MEEKNKNFVVGKGLNGEEITYAMLQEMEYEIVKKCEKSLWEDIFYIITIPPFLIYGVYVLWYIKEVKLLLILLLIVQAIFLTLYLGRFFSVDFPAKRIAKENREAFLKEHGPYYSINIQLDLKSKSEKRNNSHGTVSTILEILLGILLALFASSSSSKTSASSSKGSSSRRKGADNDLWCDCDHHWDYDCDCDSDNW